MRAEQRDTKALFKRVRERREWRDANANRAVRMRMELVADRASAVRHQSNWTTASTLWDEENTMGLGIVQEEPVESQGDNNQMGDDESGQLRRSNSRSSPRSNSRSSATVQEAQYVVMRRVERSEERLSWLENNLSARSTIRARRGLSGISVNTLAESLESHNESEQGGSSGRDKGVMSADEVLADSVGRRESFRNVAPYPAT